MLQTQSQPTGSMSATNSARNSRTVTHIGRKTNIIQCIKDTVSLALANKRLLDAGDIDNICYLLQDLHAEDVGLEMPAFHNPTATFAPTYRTIQYLHIYEDEKFTMGIFIIPPNGTIPLHDHPGMTVLSRVLYGTLHVKSYDWMPNSSPTHELLTRKLGNVGSLASLTSEKVVHGPSTSILTPSIGNIHQFTGGVEIGCAILDILTPPYDATEGRDCTYYREAQVLELRRKNGESSNPSRRFAALEEFVPPEEFCVIGAPYQGQPVDGDDRHRQ